MLETLMTCVLATGVVFAGGFYLAITFLGALWIGHKTKYPCSVALAIVFVMFTLGLFLLKICPDFPKRNHEIERTHVLNKDSLCGVGYEVEV